MKRILLTTASLGVLGLLSPALGADLPYAKAPTMAAPVYDWTGVYVGVFGGGGYGNHNINNATGPAGPSIDYTANYSSTGGIAGGEVGYNWQSGNFLAGIEGDLFWSGIRGNDSSQFAAGTFPGVSAIDADNLRWGGALLARGGIVVDRLLLFFTGGYAFGDILHTNTAAPQVAGFPVTDQFTVHANGLTGGGGLAYALTDNVLGKIEYRYTNFTGFNRPGNPFTPNGQISYSTASTYSTVTVGLDFKFGGPVVAKY